MESWARFRWSRLFQPVAAGSRVTRLELFYDLVFVFALLNVTTLVSEQLRPAALLGGGVMLALLWACWTSFTTLGNVVRADQGVVPLIGFASMAAIFVLALSLPEAFADRPGGPSGPLVFASCYFIVRVVQVVVHGWLIRGIPEQRRSWLLLAVPVVASTTLILIAALLSTPSPGTSANTWWRIGLWTVAVAIEYAAARLLRPAGWTVVSANHWAERHALIVLIALGETIIALGLGPGLAEGLPITWPVIIASMLSIATVAALWWVYFDTLAPGLEQVLHRTREPSSRAVLARDAYTYLHLPMIAGVILFALGLKRYLADLAELGEEAWLVRITGLNLYVLYGGVLLYGAAVLALAFRAGQRIRPGMLVALSLFAALTPVAGLMPALAAIGLLPVAIIGMMFAVSRREAPGRTQVRETARSEEQAFEQEQTEWRRRHL